MLSAKNRSKKHQIFEQWDRFENRRSCKGYSTCKILTLGQKLKFQKICQNPFYQSFRVVLFKKPLQRHELFEKWDRFENRPCCRWYCKILTLGEKLKLQKPCQNPFYKSFRVVLCKKPLQKTKNTRENRPFWKSAIMQRLQPMQNPHFGSKLKFRNQVKIHFKNHLELFCAKNRSKKTRNIREMRPFSKSTIMQWL